MKYKIQSRGPFGWGDLKVALEDGKYETELFATKAEAESEMAAFPDAEGWRIVPETVKEEHDFYGE